MKEFMPKINQQKKTQEKVLTIAAEARAAKAVNNSVINATAGSYYDESGNIKVFKCVDDAFRKPFYNQDLSYSSIKGSKEFEQCVLRWVFSDSYEEDYKGYNLNVVPTPGGTGAISLAMATYLEKGESVLLPSIMWPAYIQIANNLGLNISTYELFNEQGIFNIANIRDVAIAEQSKYDKVFLTLNDPCHNPTGFSLTEEDYDKLIELLNELGKSTKVILLLDIAYLDYGHNNGSSTREYFKKLKKLSNNVMVLYAVSFSKTFGIYGLRVGSLVQITKDNHESELFLSSSTYFARATWSNVTHFGMNIVEKSLSNKDVAIQFKQELKQAYDILNKRATIFVNILKEYNVPTAPYSDGFFILLLIKDESFDDLLKNSGVYGCRFGEYFRIALSSINLEESNRLAHIIGKAYKKIKK